MYRQIDFKVDDEGDLELASNGDLLLSSPAQSLSQEIAFRLKTEHSDYRPDIDQGANLRSYVGEPNTARTAAAIVENAVIALSRDGFMPPGLMVVDAVPIAINKLVLMVMYTGGIEGLETPLVIDRLINLDEQGTNNESILNVTEL